MSRLMHEDSEGLSPWQAKINEIIFGADTFLGKLFDIVLIVAILLSVAAVLLESVDDIYDVYGRELLLIEWGFTLLFTVEYILRLVSVKQPLKYAKSFFGIVDLLSIIPTYLSLFLTGANSLLVIRILRILRLFRILKLVNYLGEAEFLIAAMRQSRRKILVFLYTVMTVVIIFGSIMYLVEGPENGFNSIPESIYWAIVTLTTVGYGDISPHTPVGKMIASAVMISGYAIIAVPTGIYAAELSQVMNKARDARACEGCGRTGHEETSLYCRFCGTKLD